MIFLESGFNEGKWAGNLAKALRHRNIIEDLVPKARVWRAKWNQWIQFEEPKSNGPAFWLGKPAIIPSNDKLYAGYYVERGLQKHDNPAYIISDGWYWHAFINCLKDDRYRSTLHDHIMNLPEERRCIWIRSDKQVESFEYKEETDLSKTFLRLESLPENKWIDVVVGVGFSKEECLDLQDKIINQLIPPIRCSFEILSHIHNVRDSMKN